VQGAASSAAGGITRAPVAAGAGAGGGITLRSDLDRPSPLLVVAPGALWTLAGVVFFAHAAFFGIGWWQEHGSLRLRPGRPARGTDARRAVSALRRAGRDGMSKEASMALIERTLHDVFGPMEENGSGPSTERERAARQVLQEVHFIRYAPQLGDYSEKIQEVARHAADVVQRWA
jgi:hypothetical protein